VGCIPIREMAAISVTSRSRRAGSTRPKEKGSERSGLRVRNSRDRLIAQGRRPWVFDKLAPAPARLTSWVTWRELAGDGRLAKALEACEENGWEAPPSGS
jgi:hypothetical protein